MNRQHHAEEEGVDVVIDNNVLKKQRMRTIITAPSSSSSSSCSSLLLSFSLLPSALVSYIFSYLSFRNHISLARSNHHFHSISILRSSSPRIINILHPLPSSLSALSSTTSSSSSSSSALRSSLTWMRPEV